MARDSKTVHQHFVSFVIPAWNEEALLGRTLDALLDAARTLAYPWEIVVADDASSDRTPDLARRRGARVVAVNRRQIAATRNAGAHAAKGDLLIFVDADTLVTPQVVRGAVEAMARGAVGGGCTVRFDERIPAYAKLLLRGLTPLYRAARLAAGCFVFCTRQAFEEVGGFDERLYASEECALSWALRRRGRFVLLREHVLTSGRKLRTYSGLEILRTLVRLGLRGRRSVCDRRDKEIWYGPRRPDPDPGSPNG
jgi:glycosyltransferase involved in cell wall biosynthesis